MHDQRRKLIFAVANGSIEKALPLLHPLEQFKARDEMYSLLIRKGITGENFVEFCQKHSFSWARYGNAIFKMLLKEKQRVLSWSDLR